MMMKQAYQEVLTMHASTGLHKIFTSATDDHPESMNQALQLAFLFEHDLLTRPDPFSGSISIQSILDRFDVSRAVGHEAIRILQHRKIIHAKPGPNGGLQVITQSDENLRNTVGRFLIQQYYCVNRRKQAMEALLFVKSTLSPDNPGSDLVALMLELLDNMISGVEKNSMLWSSTHTNLRADQIAREIFNDAVTSSPGKTHLRIGHESELSERFQVSKPVIRQAIRILEAQSAVVIRRGRGGGLYFANPQSGPVSRLVALWLLGHGTTFSQIFELEHPLRVAIAMLATQNCITRPDYRYLLTLQRNIENNYEVRLVDIINMEKHVSWLADNLLLDLLLKSMTVYKVSRAHYQEIVQDHSQTYATLNLEFLHGLFDRKETQIEYYCQQKNHFLMSTDLNFVKIH